MIWLKLTPLVTLLQAVKYVVSSPVRGATSNVEGLSPLLTPRNLKECHDNESKLKVMIDYDDDPMPWIKYLIYDSNGTEIIYVDEEPNPSSATEKKNVYKGAHCIDASGCYKLRLREMGKWDSYLYKYFDHYHLKLDWDGKEIMSTNTDHLQFIGVGNCSSHICTQGEAVLNIQIEGYVHNSLKSPTFNFVIYSESGEILERQREGYASNISGAHYFETSFCMKPSHCYTVWIAKDAYYQVDYNKTVAGRGYSGNQISVFKVGGEGDCSLCNWRPFLVDSSSYQTRARDIMSMITTVSGMEEFLDMDSPQYQAACWIIYDDPYQVTAADKSLMQRYILALLFFSTNGWDWSNKLSFLSPVSECDWNRYDYDGSHRGVQCDENRNIVRINLNNRNLKGNLISELSKLMSLEYLDLAYNQLKGTIPPTIGLMKELKTLTLGANELSGTIPQRLTEIQNLEYLFLSSNDLHGELPSGFLSLPNFWYLGVSNNILNGKLPEDYRNATSLEYLILHANLFSGTIPQTFGTTQLKWLYLSNNNLNGPIPTQLSNITNIERILLSNNSLSGTIPSELGYLSSLNLLDLSHNSLDGKFPSSFTNLTSLEKLHIYNNNINGKIPQELCNHFMNSTKEYSFEADCADQQMKAKVNCPCCTECFSRFSFLEHFGECHGVELNVRIYDERSDESGNSWSIKDNLGRVILKDGPYTTNNPFKSTYTSCISPTGCYNMYTSGKLEFEVFADDTSIHYHYFSLKEESINFGYSSTSKSLQVGSCDDITVYDENTSQNETRRVIFDQLVKISGLDLNTSSVTPQYKSAEWLIYENDESEDQTIPRIIQRYVLGIFYHSTNGEFWHNHIYWMDTVHECRWFGITCYDNETVTEINLAQNNLTGSLPFEIGELSSLQKLILPNNSLNKSIPIEIANLYSLHTLDLGNNTLLGTIPTILRTLKEMRVMNLQNNSLSGKIPPEIGYLNKLISLDLSNNTITGSLPFEIYNLSMLERLDVSKNLFWGGIDEKRFQALSGLTHLDLSTNWFTGTVLRVISNFTRLRMLNIARNKFQGSIPSRIGNLVELRALLLHDNELTGSLPAEIGNLEKIVNISLSYNLLRGTIPEDLGKLRNLTHLYLHQNQLFGNANHFQRDQLDKFITDCGSILDSPAAVTCPYCTECCNSEGNCLSLSDTWPKTLNAVTFEKMRGKIGWLVVMILLSVCIGAFAMALAAMEILKTYGKHLPMYSRLKREYFAEKSVYRFFLSNSLTGWFIALITVIMQTLIFHVFLNASDFTSRSNEYEYSMECPKDSLYCTDTKTRTNFGWVMVLFVIFAFVLRDLASSTMLMYESIARSSIKRLFASLTLMFITVLAIITSVAINYARGLSNAQILLDSAVLLFLNDVDEALFSAINVISPEWVSNLGMKCSPSPNDPGTCNTASSVTMNSQQNLSALQTDNENRNVALEQPHTEAQEDYNIIKDELKLAKCERDALALEIEKLRSELDLVKNTLEQMQYGHNRDRSEERITRVFV